ncbi:MAG: DEAD/DEAH box helicase [Sarcina sp.]
MEKEDLIKIFNKSITGKKHIDALRVIENDLISESNVEKDEYIVLVKSNVISENLMSSYSCKLEIDYNKEIISSHCTCDDYEKNEFKKKNYCCKHLVATFYNDIDLIVENLKDNKTEERKRIDIPPKDSYLMSLLDDEKEIIDFEIYIEKEPWKNRLRFFLKIGDKKNVYVMRDIEQFWVHYTNRIPLHFGKNFIFDLSKQIFSKQGKKVISFIEDIFVMKKKGLNNIDGKYIYIPEFMTKAFFKQVSSSKVYLCSGFFQREVLVDINNHNPELYFDLRLEKDKFILHLRENLPQRLTYKNEVFLKGKSIYIADDTFIHEIDRFINIFERLNSIEFDRDQEEVIITRLIPKLRLVSDNLKISSSILDMIIDCPVGFKFYIDRVDNDIKLKTSIVYSDVEFNILEQPSIKKYISRDIKKENEVLSVINRIGFTVDEKEFIYSKSDDDVYKFFKFEILTLQKYGEVFYSDRVKSIKTLTRSDYNLSIGAGKENYFDFKFDISGVESNEVIHIIDALRNKIAYYKLKNGEFLDLENLELKRLVNLINVCNSSKDLKNQKTTFTTNKLMYLENYLNEVGISLDSGTEILDNLKQNLKDIEKMKFENSLHFRADLRSYQLEGFNWLNKLDYMGFAGILADDMGLGKTIQTIAFLTSKIDVKENTKVLIVAPTSLVYNWQSEFNKFTDKEFATLNIGIKLEREETLKNFFKEGDKNVLITTYGLLKRDLLIYKEYNFDYMIIDEAQNIKNSKSQITKSVKKINAINRFALTGTPIENNTLELWSIFDFLMPGYLGDEKTFNTKFNKGLRENDYVIKELNRLTAPFILRRLKKDVLLELPEKIMKDLYIPLNSKQKKAYGIYNKYVQDIMNKEKNAIVDVSDIHGNSIQILSYITKLRQLCLDPSIVLEDYKGESSKIEALLEVLDEKLSTGSKVLVFSHFTSVLKNISDKLKEFEIKFSYLDGSVNVNKRLSEIEKFNSEEANVFLISTKAGGTGLNLTSANVVIHFDPWWNPAVEDQATDRVYRIGQTKGVEVIKLIAKDTIEEKIINLQNRKRDLIYKILKAEEDISFVDSFKDILELLK